MFVGVKLLGALTRAIRNISRRKMRAALVIIALGFSMAIMISVPAGIMANQNATQRLSDISNSTISSMEAQINQTMTLVECTNVSRPSSESFPGYFNRSRFGFAFRASSSFINESIVSSIASIQGVQATVSELEVPEGYTVQSGASYFGRPFPRFVTNYTIEGVPLNSSLINNYPILPTNITEGINLHEGESGVVLLSLNNTKYFGVGVGDTVNILGSVFKVVGVYSPLRLESTGFGRANSMLYMSLSDAQRITNDTGKISRLDVYVENSSIAGSIKTEIQTVYPDLNVQDYQDLLSRLQDTETTASNTLKTDESIVGQEQTVATQEIIVAVVATSLIVLFVMLYTVRERTKEIGTLKAIGFSGWNVMSQFMLEGVLLSLVAGVVGIAIGTVGAPILSGLLLPHISAFSSGGTFGGGFGVIGTNSGIPGSIDASASISPQIMLLGLGAAALLGAVGSLYPAWRASRTRPAEAMRYE
jgi:ABC-type antimicrobial peptide transport system permease subunit